MSNGSVNRVIIVGTVGDEIETKPTKNGGHLSILSVVTNDSYIDKDGKLHSSSEWHKVIFFGKNATNLASFVQKGTKIYLEAKLKSSKYTGKDGKERSNLEIIGDSFEILFGGKSKEQSSYVHSSKPSSSYTQASYRDDNVAPRFPDDDIPF